MANKNLYFTVIDYVLFAITLLVSTLIGVYYQFKKPKNSDDLLTGGRKMPLIPTAMSLMASFVSGIAFLALPAELYSMGAGICWYMAGNIVADVMTMLFFIKPLYNVKGISIYRYLEERFGSKFLRLYASFLFTLTVLLWNAVALYAPATALAKVTGFETWVLILSVGTICTVYTALGGLKAVVWTDTIQAVIMYGGLITSLIKGTLSIGFAPEIISAAQAHGRLDGLTNVDVTPYQYISVWIGIFGGAVNWLGAFGTSQLAQQRYRSLPSPGKAQFIVLMNIPIMLIIYFLIYYNALLMFAHYSDCDPLKTGLVENKDQLVVYYTMDLLGSIYGLPGLFLASICSATLSTISSGINAVTAVVLDDYIRTIWPKMDKSKETVLTKVTALNLGAIIAGLAFAAEPLGGVFIAIQKVIGVLSGPLVGLMLFALLIPKAERIGASVGIVAGTVFILWIFVGATIYDVTFDTLPTSVDGCAALNISYQLNNYTTNNFTMQPKISQHLDIYNVAFGLYPILGASPVIIVGSIISWAKQWFEKGRVKIWAISGEECKVQNGIDLKSVKN